MNYLSVCSGIEAATVAWHPLGWCPFAFAEIEKSPSAVLAHHYPQVPNFGDITKFQEWPDADINVLVGGTPCQSFSVAGLRKGLADPRGNLALTYLALIDRYRPEWFIWENVPGVLSLDGGSAFGSILGGMAELGYGFAYRVLDAQYVRVDGFGRAVPQRRRRVFVVGNSGSWRRAAAVLFECESLSGNTPPRREAGQRVAPTIASRPTGGGGLGTDFDCDGGLITFGGNDTTGPIQVATARNAHAGPHGRLDFESETFVVDAPAVADTLTAHWERSKGAKAGNQVGLLNPIVYSITPSNSNEDYNARQTEKAQAITGNGNRPSARGGDVITLAIRGRGDTHQLEYRSDGTANAVLTPNGGRAGIGVGAIAHGYAVRRLTPEECELLQGFKRGYTAVLKADGPRYKALGNSMAVNVMRWLGFRIDLVNSLTSSQKT